MQDIHKKITKLLQLVDLEKEKIKLRKIIKNETQRRNDRKN
jgi:hypothetical protein